MLQSIHVPLLQLPKSFYKWCYHGFWPSTHLDFPPDAPQRPAHSEKVFQGASPISRSISSIDLIPADKSQHFREDKTIPLDNLASFKIWSISNKIKGDLSRKQQSCLVWDGLITSYDSKCQLTLKSQHLTILDLTIRHNRLRPNRGPYSTTDRTTLVYIRRWHSLGPPILAVNLPIAMAIFWALGNKQEKCSLNVYREPNIRHKYFKEPDRNLHVPNVARGTPFRIKAITSVLRLYWDAKTKTLNRSDHVCHAQLSSTCCKKMIPSQPIRYRQRNIAQNTGNFSRRIES